MLLWRHSSGTVIAGSIHVLPADRLIPPELTRVYEERSALVLECKYKECDPAIHLLPEGRNLGEFVKPRTYKRLRAATNALNLDLKAMSALRPWACTLEVMRAAWEGAGFASQHGVDAHFYQRAEAERKQIYELEDSRTVAALLGSLTLEQQDEYLAQVLDELHLVPGRIETLINAWRRDDVAAIDVLQSQLPRLVHDRLFVQRNIWWTQSIIKGVREAPDAFVLVGCGRLVGKDNLIELLGAEGIEFKREVGV